MKSHDWDHRWRQTNQDNRNLYWRRKKWAESGKAKPPECLWSSKQALLFRVASPNILKSYVHQTPVASPLRAQGKELTTALITYCNTSPLLPLGNLRVGITSTHLGSYFIQAAIISHFKERKKLLSYFRKHVMWDDHMATNVSRFKKLI